MALKIDMVNPYDQVEWPFLKTILKLHGFSPHFVRLIHNCVATSSYYVLLNDSPHSYFSTTRGIR